MKTNAIKLNTSYYMPSGGSKLTSFRGESQAPSTLNTPGQDTVQLKDKSGDNANQNSSGGTIHNVYNKLKMFFTTEPNFENDLDMVMYRALAY